MKAFLADTFSDEEGPLAEEGKTIYIQGSRERLLELCAFFENVAQRLQDNKPCHIHFRDSSKFWNKEDYIDVAIDVV